MEWHRSVRNRQREAEPELPWAALGKPDHSRKDDVLPCRESSLLHSETPWEAYVVSIHPRDRLGFDKLEQLVETFSHAPRCGAPDHSEARILEPVEDARSAVGARVVV